MLSCGFIVNRNPFTAKELVMALTETRNHMNTTDYVEQRRKDLIANERRFRIKQIGDIFVVQQKYSWECEDSWRDAQEFRFLWSARISLYLARKGQRWHTEYTLACENDMRNAKVLPY